MLSIVFVVVCIVFSILSPYFFTVQNFMNVLRQASYNAIAAAGVSLTVIAGGVDISIGAMQGLVGTTVVVALRASNSLLFAILVGLSIGAVVGIWNGFVVTKLGVTDIIATLAMFFALRGLAYIITDAKSVANTTDTYFNWIGVGHIWKIPVPVIWTIVIYVFFGILLKFTITGRYIYAIGGDKRAAILNGINYTRIKRLTYLFSGITASIAAIILAGRMNSGQPTAGQGFEFVVMASVIIGGCSLRGGKGTLTGTLIGVMLLTVIRNGLVLLDVSSFYQQIIIGFILITAVSIDYRKQMMAETL
jgi:ribose/xylose/arabinose/galactoside ABC-type transport system permease subunit